MTTAFRSIWEPRIGSAAASYLFWFAWIRLACNIGSTVGLFLFVFLRLSSNPVVSTLSFIFLPIIAVSIWIFFWLPRRLDEALSKHLGFKASWGRMLYLFRHPERFDIWLAARQTGMNDLDALQAAGVRVLHIRHLLKRG